MDATRLLRRSPSCMHELFVLWNDYESQLVLVQYKCNFDALALAPHPTPAGEASLNALEPAKLALITTR